MLYKVDAAYEPINEVRDSKIYAKQWEESDEINS